MLQYLELLHDCTAVNSFSVLQQFTVKTSEHNSVHTFRALERHTVRKLYRSAKTVSMRTKLLLCSNTNDSCSGFHRAECNLQQHQSWHAAWCECISTVCQMVVYSVPSWETSIIWNQPEKASSTTKAPIIKIRAIDRSGIF